MKDGKDSLGWQESQVPPLLNRREPWAGASALFVCQQRSEEISIQNPALSLAKKQR